MQFGLASTPSRMGKILTIVRLWLVATAVALSLSAFTTGHVTPRTVLNRLSSSSSFLTRTEHWFNQTLDHFSPYVNFTLLSRNSISIGLILFSADAEFVSGVVVL